MKCGMVKRIDSAQGALGDFVYVRMLSSPESSRAQKRWQLKAKPKNMNKPSQWLSELTRVALPLAFVSIVAAAASGIATPLFFAIVLSAGFVIAVVRALFPAGRLFPIAFASLIAVYAAIFSLFVEEIFRGIDPEFLVLVSVCQSCSLWLVAGFGEVKSEPLLPVQRFVVSGAS
jgi:hypothetical protein